jgi:pimeloyl-ACP methyl ester carboxylesterase
MRIIDTGDASIATESFGAAGDPPIVLVMGATASMLGWPDEMCAELAAGGHFVIRFDHRDTGASTTAPLGAAAYDVEDMARDLLAIIDGYHLQSANIVGMSLGGYMAQMVAVDDPARVTSLTLIASEPLGWDGAPLPGISSAFLDHFEGFAALDWSDENAVEDFLLVIERLCAGSGAPFDEAGMRSRIRAILGRTDSAASMFNHGSRTTRRDWAGRFREIGQKTLIIHGAEDPILPFANGEALAAGIRNAQLLGLPGVGHELPARAVPRIVDAIAAHVRAA